MFENVDKEFLFMEVDLLLTLTPLRLRFMACCAAADMAGFLLAAAAARDF